MLVRVCVLVWRRDFDNHNAKFYHIYLTQTFLIRLISRSNEGVLNIKNT